MIPINTATSPSILRPSYLPGTILTLQQIIQHRPRLRLSTAFPIQRSVPWRGGAWRRYFSSDTGLETKSRIRRRRVDRRGYDVYIYLRRVSPLLVVKTGRSICTRYEASMHPKNPLLSPIDDCNKSHWLPGSYIPVAVRWNSTTDGGIRDVDFPSLRWVLLSFLFPWRATFRIFFFWKFEQRKNIK